MQRHRVGGGNDMKIEKTVYFVRHGQSVDNVSPVFQAPNSPLSETGRRQAECIAERASKLQFEALIASPFTRAKETAEAVARVTGVTPEFSDLFVERIKPSSINGKPFEDRVANAIWQNWEKSLHTSGMRVEDGENFDDLVARADKALSFLTERPERAIAVITHGFFLRTIVARVLLGPLLSGELFARFQRLASMENTGLTVVRYHGRYDEESRWRLWIYNDHAHLG